MTDVLWVLVLLASRVCAVTFVAFALVTAWQQKRLLLQLALLILVACYAWLIFAAKINTAHPVNIISNIGIAILCHSISFERRKNRRWMNYGSRQLD